MHCIVSHKAMANSKFSNRNKVNLVQELSKVIGFINTYEWLDGLIEVIDRKTTLTNIAKAT